MIMLALTSTRLALFMLALLPLIGALAAGPPGAAAGLALQGLLHDELAEASRVSYTITGSWDEPEIEPVEVERAGG